MRNQVKTLLVWGVPLVLLLSVCAYCVTPRASNGSKTASPIAAEAVPPAPPPRATDKKAAAKKRVGPSERTIATLAAKRFVERINSADPGHYLIAGATIDSGMPTMLVIEVTDTWAESNKVRRRSNAEDLWRTWVSVVAESAPKRPDPDQWRIAIVDRHGHRIGGSRVWAGSLIWVDD